MQVKGKLKNRPKIAMPREDKQHAIPREQHGTAPYAKPHTCRYCAGAFANASNLARHVRTQHPGSDSSQLL